MPEAEENEMPGAEMVEPPKGKKKPPPGDMPAGEMSEAKPEQKDGKK